MNCAFSVWLPSNEVTSTMYTFIFAGLGKERHWLLRGVMFQVGLCVSQQVAVPRKQSTDTGETGEVGRKHGRKRLEGHGA